MRIRAILKWSLSVVLYYTGLVWLARRRVPPGVLILVFHRVKPARLDDGMTVSEAVFEAQLQYLKKMCQVISFDMASEMLNGKRALRESAIAISFDDGYRDNYTRAWPVLARYGVPATIFVTVGPLEGEGALWTEVIREALWASSSQVLDLRAREWGLWPLRTDMEKLVCLRAVKRRLKALPDPERQTKLLGIIEGLGSRKEPGVEEQMLTWEMLREMSKGGITVGAHTMSHKILTHIEPAEAEWEIAESKRRIEERLGEPVRHFAYPNGTRSDWNCEIQNLVKQAGFDTACTTVRGTNSAGHDLYALRRLEITD